MKKSLMFSLSFSPSPSPFGHAFRPGQKSPRRRQVRLGLHPEGEIPELEDVAGTEAQYKGPSPTGVSDHLRQPGRLRLHQGQEGQVRRRRHDRPGQLRQDKKLKFITSCTRSRATTPRAATGSGRSTSPAARWTRKARSTSASSATSPEEQRLRLHEQDEVNASA